MKRITSSSNPLVKDIIRLRKSTVRRDQGVILIEGYKEIALAAKSGIELATLVYCPDCAATALSPDTIPVRQTVHTDSVVFGKISYRENPDGFLALAKRPRPELKGLKLGVSPLIVLVEAVEKPGNLGAIIRTADAAGVDAVIALASQTDLYHPNVIRSSIGTIFSVPTVAVDKAELMPWLDEHKFATIATTPGAKTLYTDFDYRVPCAILVGAEHNGLSGFWLHEAVKQVKIPMYGQADSLNASVSSAIVLYEAVRQRRLLDK